MVSAMKRLGRSKPIHGSPNSITRINDKDVNVLFMLEEYNTDFSLEDTMIET